VRKWIKEIGPNIRPKIPSTYAGKMICFNLGVGIKLLKSLYIIAIQWSKPNAGFVSLNVNGAASDDNSGGGGVIRDDKGNCIDAYCCFFGTGTNNYAESSTLLYGQAMCKDRGFNKIMVQCDSKLVTFWFQNKANIPWALKYIWSRIKKIAIGLDLQIIHVYREANAVADSLAKMGMKEKINRRFGINIPHSIRGLIRLDKTNTKYICFCK